MNKIDENYNESSFKVLTDYEAITTSPGMYIGDTSTPTHLIGELLDNALDEVLAGHANIILINIDTKNNIYSVCDNGRGIPTSNDIPIIISTKLNSGSKFKGFKKSYTICVGKHGVGMSVVNALSEFYKIEIIRDSIYSIFEFDNFNLIKKYSVGINTQPFSTKITFKPKKNIFENLIPDINKIRERLLVASAHISNSTFVLIVDDNREIIKINEDEYFKQYLKDEENTNIINFEINDKKIINDNNITEKLNIKLCYSLNGAISPKIISSVNLLPIEDGTHIKLLKNVLKDVFSFYGKKLNKNFDIQDVFCGLRAYVDLYLIEPEFNSQIKYQLINRKTYLEPLFDKFQSVLKNYFNKNQEDLLLILDKFEEYRSNFNSKKAQVSSSKKSKNTKLKDCKRRDGELFIVEGDSAAGSLIQCRDSNIHAVLPLRGKPPSIDINKKKKSPLLENEEIQTIISALGTGIGATFDISKLRYSKIILCSDSDPDGNHINCLLIAVISYLFPELIKQGYLYICQTPLFAVNKGKTFIPLWTKEELDDARNKNLTITRYKGIGEFNPWQLEICALTNKRKLIQVTYTKNFDKIAKLLLKSDVKRLLLEGKFTLNG